MRNRIVICLMLTVCVLAVSCGYCRQASATMDSRNLPIIMYHSVLKSRCGQYIIHPDSLEQDIINLKMRGYQSVFLSEVVDFVNGKGTLPAKPIVLTFDDGHYNNLHYALPILIKHNFKAVINIIGAFSAFSTDSGDHSNANYSHLTWEQIQLLDRSGHFEIGNHTYNMHKYTPRMGIIRIKGESDEQYRANLIKDIGRLQSILKDKCDIRCSVFAYPFGRYSEYSESVIKSMGFKAVLTCCEKPNTIAVGNQDKLLRLNRYNRDGREQSAVFINKVAK